MKSWNKHCYRVGINYTQQQMQELESKADFLYKSFVNCLWINMYNSIDNKKINANNLASAIRTGKSNLQKWLVIQIENEFEEKIKKY